MDKTALLNAWLEQDKTLDKVEKALEVVKSRRSQIAKQIHDGHGKGPHEIEPGRFVTIVQMGETFFVKAAKLAADGTPAKTGPDAQEVAKLVAAITAPMASGDVAKALGTSPGPKLSELLKHACDNGLIEKVGERAQTKYQPKSVS